MMTIMADDSYTSLSSSSSSLISSRESNDDAHLVDQQPPANAPYVLFYCRDSNGVTVEERQIYLDKQCKIGRSVAKIKPESNNAIFDCKVLSRNHALLWHEGNKFYLQDTKSSNGTYLNGQRLGKSNEDSASFELNSGDVIQFGVDVTENTKKVTHGCITVEVKLFHPSGVEAISTQNSQQNKVDIQAQELYQLSIYMQEAILREQALQQKISNLQHFIQHAQELSENGWLALIDEDRLLSRIDFLEKQLSIYTSKSNPSEDTLKQTINSLKEEKFELEKEAKLSIQRLIDEKSNLIQKCDQLKTNLTTIGQETDMLSSTHESTKRELVELASKHQDLLNETNCLNLCVSDLKQKLNEKQDKFEVEKQQYDKQICEYVEQEKQLNAKIESLLAENDFQKQQLDGMKNRLKTDFSGESECVPHETKISNYLSFESSLNDAQLTELDLLRQKLSDFELLFVQYQEKMDNLSNENELMKSQIELNKKLNESNQELKDNLDLATEQIEVLGKECRLVREENETIQKLRQLDYENFLEEVKKTKLLEQQIQDLGMQIDERSSKISRLENEINLNRQTQSSNTPLVILNEDIKLEESQDLLSSSSSSTNDFHSLKSECCELKSQIESIEDEMKKVREEKNELNEDYTELEKSYRQLQKLKEILEAKESQMQLNLTDAQKEADQYKLELSQALSRIKELEDDYEAHNNLNDDENDTSDGSVCDGARRSVNSNYDSLALRTRIVSYISMIPLGILLLAILIACSPYLATITATTG